MGHSTLPGVFPVQYPYNPQTSHKTLNYKDWPTDLLETLLRLKLATFQYGVFQVVPLVAVDNSTLCNHNINNYKPNASRLTKSSEKAAYFIVRRTVPHTTIVRS